MIISTYGGEWICDDKDPMGEVNASIRLLDGTIIWPIQRAVKRYQMVRKIVSMRMPVP